MQNDAHLPQQHEPPSSARRGSEVPAPPQPAPTVHDARTLEFVEGPGRDYWWDLINEAVRRRIKERVGEPIDWWANRHSTEKERPYAVVLGTRGLAVTKPTMTNAGRPAHQVTVWHFDPQSLGFAIVRQRPWAGAGPVTRGTAASPDPRLPLTTRVRGFLGNLPAEAQGRLQEPFLDGDQLLASDFYYYGSEEHLNVWCYLAWTRTVTFASGERVAPAGAPPQAATWDLVCRRATVIRPGDAQRKAASAGRGEPSGPKAPMRETILSPGPLEEKSTLAVTIYLSDEGIHDQVEAAVEDWLASARLIVDEREEPIIGSWLRRMRAGVMQAVSAPAAQDALLTATHAVDTRVLLAQDAAVTATLLQGVAPVIASLQPTKDAVVRAGAVLIVKVDWVVRVHQLTAAQQVMLNHQPQLQSSPTAIIAALQLNGTDGNGAAPEIG